MASLGSFVVGDVNVMVTWGVVDLFDTRLSRFAE